MEKACMVRAFSFLFFPIQIAGGIRIGDSLVSIPISIPIPISILIGKKTVYLSADD